MGKTLNYVVGCNGTCRVLGIAHVSYKVWQTWYESEVPRDSDTNYN